MAVLRGLQNSLGAHLVVVQLDELLVEYWQTLVRVARHKNRSDVREDLDVTTYPTRVRVTPESVVSGMDTISVASQTWQRRAVVSRHVD